MGSSITHILANHCTFSNPEKPGTDDMIDS